MPDQPIAPLDIPERYEDVTAEWLTQALRAGGVLGEQTVTSFEVKPLSAVKSRNSSLASIAVQYDGNSEGLPDSMFAKFVSRIPGNREFAAQRDVFRREIALYENLGDVIPMDVPVMYFGGIQAGSDVGILLMEEIVGESKQNLPYMERHLSSGEAFLGLKSLSKLHAKWWGDQSLRGYEWLGTIADDGKSFWYPMYEQAWERMRPTVESALSSAEIRICDGLSNYIPDLASQLENMPATLCHGDFHTGNLLWDKLGEPATVWAVDWQRSMQAPAVIDIAWFLGVGNSSGSEQVGSRYLPAYHAALMSHGITGYGYDQFLSDYRFGLMYALVRFVGALANLDMVMDDVGDFIRLCLGNIASGAVDAGCGELV